jgi:chromosome segregation ATPase
MTKQKILKKIVSTPSDRGDALVHAFRSVTESVLASQAKQKRRVANLEKTIQTQATQLQKKDLQLAELKEQLSAKNSDLAKQKKTIEEQTTLIARLRAQLKTQDTALSEQTQTSQKQSGRISSLQANLKTQKTFIAHLQKIIRDQQDTIRSTQQTTLQTQYKQVTEIDTLREQLQTEKATTKKLRAEIKRLRQPQQLPQTPASSTDPLLYAQVCQLRADLNQLLQQLRQATHQYERTTSSQIPLDPSSETLYANIKNIIDQYST